MTLAEADVVVQRFFASIELAFPELNAAGLGGVTVNGAHLFFEYQAPTTSLKCSALLYQFDTLPELEMLKSFEEEAKETDPGGGAVEYQGENRGVFLFRRYSVPPEDAQFRAEMEHLMGASVRWRREAMERIAIRGHAHVQGPAVGFFPDKKPNPAGL